MDSTGAACRELKKKFRPSENLKTRHCSLAYSSHHTIEESSRDPHAVFETLIEEPVPNQIWAELFKVTLQMRQSYFALTSFMTSMG